MNIALIMPLPICILLLVVVEVKANPSRAIGAPSILSAGSPSSRSFPNPRRNEIHCELITPPLGEYRRNRGRVFAATSDNSGKGAPWQPLDSSCNEIYASDDEGSYEEPKKVAHWRIEGKNLIQVNSSEYSALESDHTYIVVKNVGSPGKMEYKNRTTIHPTFYQYTVYYWIGSRSSELDARNAAYFAMIQTTCMRDELKIRRESEGFESKAFKMLFGKDEDDGEASKDVDMNKERMFMVNEDNGLQLKEVELKIIYTLATGSCFVFVSRKVHIGCGSDAPESPKRAVKELAKIMMKKKGLEIEETQMHLVNSLFGELAPEDEHDLHHFFGEFERSSKEADDNQPIIFTPEEMRRVLGQTRWLDEQEYFNIDIIRIYIDLIGYLCEEPYKSYNQLRMAELNSNDCYLVDSHSNVGLFIWLGKESSMFVRTQAAERAETYLRKKGYHLATPVTFVEEEDLPPDTWLHEMVVLLKPENNQDDVPRPPMY